jgi:hypothetical protein
MTAQSLGKQFSSFSGVDIRAIVDGNVVGTMQAISYAVQREKAPIYVMGKVDPLSFSRGKRGIAGTIISLLLDQHLIYHPAFAGKTYIGDKDALVPGVLPAGTADDLGAAIDSQNLQGTTDAIGVNGVDDLWASAGISYVDQIMPFDVTIVACSEYGQASAMRIFGCEILNEGSGFSIDDIVIETQMTYVCRTVAPWAKLGEWKLGATGAFGNYNEAPAASPPTTA